MRIRPLAITDLPEIRKLYRQMLQETKDTPGILHYPQWDETTPEEMHDFLFEQLLNPSDQWVGIVAVVGDSVVTPEGAVKGGRPKGMVFGSIYRRPIGMPKVVGHCDLLYVDPSQRAGRGQRAMAVQLIRAMASEARRREPQCVFEGSYVPGTHGEVLWRRLGLRPYVVWCAWVDAEGKPRADDFFRGHGVVNGQSSRRASGNGAALPSVDSAVHAVHVRGAAADERRPADQSGADR